MLAATWNLRNETTKAFSSLDQALHPEGAAVVTRKHGPQAGANHLSVAITSVRTTANIFRHAPPTLQLVCSMLPPTCLSTPFSLQRSVPAPVSPALSYWRDDDTPIAPSGLGLRFGPSHSHSHFLVPASGATLRVRSGPTAYKSPTPRAA